MRKARPREKNSLIPKLVNYKISLKPSSAWPQSTSSSPLLCCQKRKTEYGPGRVWSLVSPFSSLGLFAPLENKRVKLAIFLTVVFCDGGDRDLWKRKGGHWSSQQDWPDAFKRDDLRFFSSFPPSLTEDLLIFILCQALCRTSLWIGLQRLIGHSLCR